MASHKERNVDCLKITEQEYSQMTNQASPNSKCWRKDVYKRQALGFLRYGYQGDAFELTETGKALAQARTQGEELNSQEKELLTSAVLAYPPVVRILSLLGEGEGAHLTKFELGKQLGFVGEDGFTSLPQTVLVRSLASSKDAKEKNKMKTDWDGSSDKYARMIAKWLEKLGLVKQETKPVTVTLAGRKYTESIGQSYVITGLGITALNRTCLLYTSAGIEGLARYTGMDQKGVYFRARHFPTESECICRCDKATGKVEVLSQLSFDREDCYYHVDVQGCKVYRITEGEETCLVKGIVNSGVQGEYQKQLGEFVSCVEDRFLITRKVMTDSHGNYEFEYHSICDIKRCV